jgi:hypothetical protein
VAFQSSFACSTRFSLQALAALHSDTPGFRVAYKRRAVPLQPPLRPNRVEMRDATFCFCPSGFGAHDLMTCKYMHGEWGAAGY